MRGIILAGGNGCRLAPLTKTINKHCLPVGNVPMIFHPLRVLRINQITDITIVSSPSGVGQLAAILGSGHEHGCRFTYKVQDQPGGIAQALACAEDESDEPTAVILGDNVFLPPPVIKTNVMMARCYLYPLQDREQLKAFGVPEFNDNFKVKNIVEKPDNPPSKYAVTGLYVFNAGLWSIIDTVKPSKRGEVEITDLLNLYAQAEGLAWAEVFGWWGDAGTWDGLTACDRNIRNGVRET